MFAPISWLSDFVDITIPLPDLMWRLTEVGLTCEKVTQVDSDPILELEITPNRPDCMSIVGIAREIAAIQHSPLKLHEYKLDAAEKSILPMEFKVDYRLFERWSAISIADVTVAPSPSWMRERLIKIGLRPINNIVDITNYVMFELGIPLHAFDYDEIKGGIMSVERSQGGEKFTSVDELTYELPKDAMIIRDSERIIDLVGIKGGLNSGIGPKTKNVLLHVTIDNPILIRKASQSLKLRSDASAIYERGPDKGGTINALKRAASLVLELAGGHIASEIIDLKEKDFTPWTVTLTHKQLINVLGVEMDPDAVVALLTRLHLKAVCSADGMYSVTIPTYRNDLHISEDIIEEVARMYGYNKFPKTLPMGAIPTEKVPYFWNWSFEEKVKTILWASGLYEFYTYSLVSKDQLGRLGFDISKAAKVENPVSNEFEYLRPTLLGNMIEAIKHNEPLLMPFQAFELGRIYSWTGDKATERNRLTLGFGGYDFFFAKGILEEFFSRLGIPIVFSSGKGTASFLSHLFHSTNWTEIGTNGQTIGVLGMVNIKTRTNFELKSDVYIADIDFEALKNCSEETVIYKPIPSHPPIIEDLSFAVKEETPIGLVIHAISTLSDKIARIILLDQYKQMKTFRIIYQDAAKTLTSKEVAIIREQIVAMVAKQFGMTMRS